LQKPLELHEIEVERIQIDSDVENVENLEFKSFSLREFSQSCASLQQNTEELVQYLHEKLGSWREQGYRVLVHTHTVHLAQRLRLLLEKAGFQAVVTDETEYLWHDWLEHQDRDKSLIHLIPRALPDSGRWPDERLLLLRD